jgi:hypothetical protein
MRPTQGVLVSGLDLVWTMFVFLFSGGVNYEASLAAQNHRGYHAGICYS